MIDGAGDFIKWASALGYIPGGGGSGGVTPLQVQQNAFNFAAGLGADDHFVVNLSPAVLTLTNGLPIYMVSGFTNLTTTPTLKINALPEKLIVSTSGEALIVDDIQAGAAYLFIYSSADDNFQLINPSISNANAYLVQKNYFNYAIDFGAADAYEANFPFAPLVTLAGGLSAIVQIDNTNTGPSTLTLNGQTAPIVGISGGALIAGEIIGGGISEFIYSDNYAAFILLNSAITPGGGTVGNGTINNLAYYAASGNTISSLATLNNGVLITSNTGVPSLLANGTAGYVLTANSGASPSWQAQGYLSNAVLLNPSAPQTIGGFGLTISAGGITVRDSIRSTTNSIYAGSSGFSGGYYSYPSTASSGYLQLSATNNAGDFAGILTNASLSAARGWELPDVSGTIALTTTAVLLNPAADQTIVAHNLTISNGGLTTASDILVNSITVGVGAYRDVGNTNLAVGVGALSGNATGTSNTGIGFAALIGTVSGNGNTAVGTGAAQINDGTGNTFTGSNSAALLGITSNGDYNTFFGCSTGLAGAGVGAQDFQGGNSNTFVGFNVTGNSYDQNGTIGIGALAVADAATGVLSTQFGSGISIGSSSFPVGFRGDGTPIPAGGAHYWRMKINDAYYDIPILPDATTISWPSTGTLATTSGSPFVFVVGPDSIYTTISSAMTAAALVGTSSQQCLVLIQPGIYVENITLASYVSVVGESGKDESSVIIQGNTLYNASEAGNISFSLSNLSFITPLSGGSALTISGSSTLNVYINNCIINGLYGNAFVFNNPNNGYLTNCTVTAGGGYSCFIISGGIVKVNDSSISTSNTTSKISANATLEFNYCVVSDSYDLTDTSVIMANYSTFTGINLTYIFNVDASASAEVSFLVVNSNDASGNWVVGTGALLYNAIYPIGGSSAHIDPGLIIISSDFLVGNLVLGAMLNPQYGGTGINNGSKTINLGSPTSGYLLTSDSLGNATWQAGPAPAVNPWISITTNSYSAAVNTNYVVNTASGLTTITLPAVAAFGATISLEGIAAGGWSLVANSGQTIICGIDTSSVAGSISSIDARDGLQLVCIVANTTWKIRNISTGFNII